MTPLTALAFCLLLSAPAATETPAGSFPSINEHYQSIRLALLEDSTKGVRKHAAAIAKLATDLKDSPTAARAGVTDADLATVEELLPEVVQRAEVLAKAKKIAAQREALKKLTQPLVRWHEKLTGEKPRVAYCPMERGAWFQPDGVLGNPYGGTRMPRCGSFLEQ